MVQQFTYELITGIVMMIENRVDRTVRNLLQLFVGAHCQHLRGHPNQNQPMALYSSPWKHPGAGPQITAANFGVVVRLIIVVNAFEHELSCVIPMPEVAGGPRELHQAFS